MNKTILNITQLSDEEENQIGKELETQVSGNLSFTASNEDRVKKIFNKLLPNVSREKINNRFKIVKDKDVNAFSIAGGMIYINTGLVDFVKSDEELAFVIAHEIAYNELKHCIGRIQYGVNA
ncbi:MAG: M48 family metallopeptidase [Ignavibacteriaceae bacterium]|nr:M48 family metallopeptidase [Ignavibacteriaceae bacterium]